MDGPDEKGLEGEMLVQWLTPLGMPSAAPVSCVTAKQATATSPPFHPTYRVSKSAVQECFLLWICHGFWENSVLVFCLLDGCLLK